MSTLGSNEENEYFCTWHVSLTPINIPERSDLNACFPKSATGDTRECGLSSYRDTQGYVADPINTYTGGFDYSIVDLSLPTTAMDLVFQHTYSSLATELYTTTMGYGWTHNHDTRLIFSDDPQGEDQAVWFKGHTTNQYKFRDNGDDTFDEYPGVLATLELNGDYYEVTDPSQNVYRFYDGVGADSALKGRLYEWQTPEGFSFSYTYDTNGLLDQVDGPHGQSLNFDYTDYSGTSRLTSVSDNTGTTGREVSFGYDLTSGDLITVTDVLEAEWIYSYKDDVNYPHLLEMITDPRSTTILTTTYDTEGRAISQEDALNTIANITYHDDRSSVIENGRSFTTTHTYNGLETLVGETNPSNHMVEKEYDRNFRPTVISNTYQTELLWSSTGANLEQITNADGEITDLDYDSLNNLTAFTDPMSHTTSFGYDETLLISTTNALAQTTMYTYTTAADESQPEGLLKEVSTPLGTTEYEYNLSGQLIATTNALDQASSYTYNDQGWLESVTDPAGRTNWTCYDLAGRVVRMIVNASGSDACSTSYLPGSAVDEDRITTYTYDVVGNLIAVEDPTGRVMRSYYDDTNRPVTVVQNLVGQAINVTTPPERDAVHDQNIRTDTEYDANGNMTSTEDNAGIETFYCYDELDRLAKTVQNPVGSYSQACMPGYVPSTVADEDIISQTEYDERGNVIKTSDHEGNETQTCYDVLNRPVRTVFNSSVSDPCESYTPNAAADQDVINDTKYDANGNVIAQIEWLVEDSQVTSHTTRTYYNALNQPYLLIRNLTYQGWDIETPPPSSAFDNNENVAIETIYDPDNSLAIATVEYLVEDSQVISYTTRTYYDELGQPIAIVQNLTGDPNIYDQNWPAFDPASHDQNVRIEMVYDTVGNQIATKEVLAEDNVIVTRTYYDDLGRLETVVRNLTGSIYDPPPTRNQNTPDENVRTDVSYDDRGNIVTQTDPLGNITTFQYDHLNRQISVNDPLHQEKTTTFSNASQLQTVVDAKGIVTHYTYDSLGHLTKVTENFQAGVVGDQETNVETKYTYDKIGNLISIEDANGNVTHFDYDALDRLKNETDPLSHSWSYKYDKRGNPIQTKDANGAVINYQYDALNRLTAIDYPYPDADVFFSYNALGWRTGMIDGLGSTSWDYDGLGRPTTINDPFSNFVGYQYDSRGNRTELVYPDGKTVSYDYDALGRLEEVTDWNTQITSYTYDQSGQIKTASLPNGISSSYNYNQVGWLISLAHDTLNETLSSFSYQYDAVGNRIQATETMLTPGGEYSYLIETPEMAAIPLVGGTDTRTTDGDLYLFGWQDPSEFLSDLIFQGKGPGVRAKLIAAPNASSSPVTITVQDTNGHAEEGLKVYAFDGTAYTGVNGTTNARGEVILTLSNGSYRFRADKNGTHFWSSETNHCTIPDCLEAGVITTVPVTINIQNSLGEPENGLKVYAFDGTSYTGFNQTTDENGEALFTLPQDEYRFRADKNGTQFWSGEENHCFVPECTTSVVTTTLPLTVNVQDTNGQAENGLKVYAFDDSSYTGYWKSTDLNGIATFTLPQGDYRFRADKNGTQFWSGAANHCEVPGCSGVAIATTLPLTISVHTTDGQPEQGLPVYVFDETTYTNYHSITDESGEVVFVLPQGDYRFRSDKDGTRFWSDQTNHCSIPGCNESSVIVTGDGTVITVQDTNGQPRSDLPVYVFDDSSYTGYHGNTDTNGQVSFTLPSGEYRFRADKDGTRFWSGLENHCIVPSCTGAMVTVTIPLSVIVQNTDGLPEEGLKVYAFNGTSYTGFNQTTNENGEVSFTLPQGDYRFRADKNGTQFWSDSVNHCTIPGCLNTIISTTLPLSLTVQNTDGQPEEGLKVYAFNGTSYTGFNQTTNENGEVSFTLPQGDYRFRADKNGTQFWSNSANHCTIPGCLNTVISTTLPLSLTVQNTDGQPEEGLKVYAFNGTSYTGFNQTTDENGEVYFTLPQGEYRFRADKNGTHFWSANINDCKVPGCTTSTVTTTLPLTVTIKNEGGTPQSGLKVYAFDGTVYTGYNKTTGDDGFSIFTLPQGHYRFRADSDGEQYWSGETNHCTLPGCLNAAITISGGITLETNVITYTYDSLNRLTDADYAPVGTGGNRAYFDYTYDAVGNRLTLASDQFATVSYIYDAANRLTSVGGLPFTWDNNGNLTDDGQSTYGYNAANQMISQGSTGIGGGTSFNYAYDGLGNRYQQSHCASFPDPSCETTNFTLDIAARLTQVLAHENNTYLYGMGRISQQNATTTDYFLTDALGSVRQLTDPSGAVTLTKSYTPYGEVLSTDGSGNTSYGFTGEWTDNTGMVYLRSRYLETSIGRFTTRDSWSGDPLRPNSQNRYVYAENNPVRYTDPTGHCIFGLDTLVCIAIAGTLGGILGGMAYHGYEVLTSENPCARWDWNRALIWGGVGGAIGAPLALIGGYIGINYLGWWGATKAAGTAGSGLTAACADGDCTNEAFSVQRGITVIGSSVDNYAAKAREIGANYLKLPQQIWESMSPVKFWKEYNKPFIIEAALRRDIFKLVTPLKNIKVDSPLWKEITLLTQKLGYTFTYDGKYLMPPP